MGVMMVRAKIREDAMAEAEAAAEKMFSAVNEAQPEGIRYASCKLADGATFVALLQLDDGVENPLPAIDAWREFQEKVESWRVEPPVMEQLEVVGSYRLFG